jgi:DNA-directed RNA polymerase specialized sigma24 family protein
LFDDLTLFLRAHQQEIRETVKYLCIRHGVTDTYADDIQQETLKLLIENNYERMKKLVGKSNFYISASIRNLFIDIMRFRKKEQGEPVRFHNSEEAKRLGDMAIKLETLLYRDRFSYPEACGILTSHFTSLTESEVYDLYLKLPIRKTVMRREENPDTDELPSPSLMPDEILIDKEMHDLKSKMESVIQEIKKTLSGDDILLLKMHYEDDMKLSVIAAALHTERRLIEKRLRIIINRFKNGIIARGIDVKDAVEMIAYIIQQGASDG